MTRHVLSSMCSVVLIGLLGACGERMEKDQQARVASASQELVAGGKVQVCHIPPGNPGNGHIITISEADLAEHLGHGDVAGPCRIYVNAARPDDNGSGSTPETAKRTIQAALAIADPPIWVLVAEGDYVGSWGAGTDVRLKDGVSLYGGFDPTFGTRDPVAHRTRIIDTSELGGDYLYPNRAVTVPSGVGSATVMDGFMVQGGSGTVNAAVLVEGGSAVEIRNNWLRGGDACESDWACRSVGIHLDTGSLADVRGNLIEATVGYYTFAVWIFESSPIVESNVIIGGRGSFVATGVSTYLGNPLIVGNTIDGGNGGLYGMGINIVGGAPAVENNIVFASGGSYGRICVESDYYPWTIASFRNNDLFDCPSALYARIGPIEGAPPCPFNDAFACVTSIASLNDPAVVDAAVASGNVSVDPDFADRAGRDFHLTSQSPSAVTAGGLSNSEVYQTDKDGHPRTIPWSIGAYEKD